MNASNRTALSAQPSRRGMRPSREVLLAQTLQQWRQLSGDLWVFAYGSLVWRPEFEFAERQHAMAYGWHRALQMWSTINRGTPEFPGLVFALLKGGSCHGVVYRIPGSVAEASLLQLWEREMPGGVYDPRWLRCQTATGAVNALAFTLCKSSPRYCGELSDQQYRAIFQQARGRYGTTLDYAKQTYASLRSEGIEDRALAKILQLAA
jgi:glutathione-specific gamma-glutamylcyclotransferase